MSDINLDIMEKEVMDGLKDFQRETVKRIDSLFQKGQNRVLVADEVGLGKTMVAKGVIAKFANHRYNIEGDSLIKVAYVCSNSAIVDQNLDDLNITGNFDVENSFTSRLSMQHLNIFKQEYIAKNSDIKIQLIPLTPRTSFKVENSPGTIHERALMFSILKRVPGLAIFENHLNNIFCYDARKSWDAAKGKMEYEVIDCEDVCEGEYEKYMNKLFWDNGDEDVKYSQDIDDLIKFCKEIEAKGFDFAKMKDKCKSHIVNFRKIFAEISLEKLDVDLIIMDEFQRFKDLLNSDEESDLGILTKKFFNGNARILLLSATPYKLYSTLEEISNENIDEHYSEFFELINFLKKSEIEQERFKEIWSDYSICLREFDKDKSSFITAKRNAENELFKNICRTERISEDELDDIINDDKIKNPISVLDEDIASFIKVQKILDETININVPVDYIKSSPYIMSFMENYQLKKKIEDYFKEHPNDMDAINDDLLWLDKEEIDSYSKISPNNGRLNYLMNDVFNQNESHLLWVPPSMPYYELGGVFKNHEDFSKTLIFSSWEMVPRMISSLVSYEAERQTVGQLNLNIKYFSPDGLDNSKRRSYSRLKFLKDSNYYNTPNIKVQMPVFMLLYPSHFLSEVYKPSECLNRKLSIDKIEEEIKTKIKHELDKIQCSEVGDEDYSWYVLAPLILDEKNHVESWFDPFCTSEKLLGERYFKELTKLKNRYDSEKSKLGRKPDDLVDVLCDMAIGSPAICAYRAYENKFPINHSIKSHLKASTQIARKFIRYMNLPESIAVINLHFDVDSEKSYWKSVLEYSKDGNLQAVFDEYIHLLSKNDKNVEKQINKIANKFSESFEYVTTFLNFDTLDNFKSRIENSESQPNRFRIHYATSFAKGQDDEKSNRKKTIMDAFNSPFRPFVLASTSIGQEGLDFHKYCRKIVHWNLPSNPIDLEQREGRINRFKCLAIRQNVAKRFGKSDVKFSNDVWNDLFDRANDTDGKNSSELIPFWGLKEYDENLKIERIVPSYPYSIDKIKYNRLIEILSLYRLTLGQPRQEGLIKKFIDEKNIDKNELNDLFINLSPYYKK